MTTPRSRRARPVGRVRVRGWWGLSVLLAVSFLVPWPSSFIEAQYSRTVYPRVQVVMTTASNVVPVAVIDLAIALGVCVLAFALVRFVRAGRERGWSSAVWEAFRRLVRLAALVGLAFFVCWGLNYRRVPLEVTLAGAGANQPPSGLLLDLTRRAARAAATVRPQSQHWSDDYSDLAHRLEGPFNTMLERLGLPRLSVAGRPKVSRVLTPFFTAAGVTGMVNPVALESIVHPELLRFERPMVLAHEWAHLAGFADEADASAIAWAACASGDAGLAYSAHFFVILEAAPVLARAEWRAIRQGLDQGIVDDIAALNTRLERQQPAVREAAFQVYDHYLKSNRVSDGVRSYGRVVRVLLTPPMRALAPQ